MIEGGRGAPKEALVLHTLWHRKNLCHKHPFESHDWNRSASLNRGRRRTSDPATRYIIQASGGRQPTGSAMIETDQPVEIIVIKGGRGTGGPPNERLGAEGTRCLTIDV